MSRIFAIVLAAFMAVGCATVGVNVKTPKERLAYVDGEIAAALLAAADLKAAGVLSPEVIEVINNIVPVYKESRNVAYAAIASGDLETVEGQIKLLNQLLWDLRSRLPQESKYEQRGFGSRYSAINHTALAA